MQERKCFSCRGFEHIICNCINRESMKKKCLTYQSSNLFEVLARRVINVGVLSRGDANEDRKMILREEKVEKEKKVKKEKPVEVRKTEKKELLREGTVKIGLERIDTQEGITVEGLLDSGATGLVMSSNFVRKKGFKLKKKIKRPIYVRNVDRTFNQGGLMEYTVKVNIYYQIHRERTEIDMIGEQKWNVILRMPWLACYDSEIDWKLEK